jgi:hypothetical protein
MFSLQPPRHIPTLPIATETRCSRHVCFPSHSDITADIPGRSVRANSSHAGGIAGIVLQAPMRKHFRTERLLPGGISVLTTRRGLLEGGSPITSAAIGGVSGSL